MCIYICQKWLCTFITCEELYHKPHEEDSYTGKKMEWAIFIIMPNIISKYNSIFFSFFMKTAS